MYRIRRKYRIGALLAILILLLTLVPAVLAAETASASTMQLTRTEGTVSAANASGRSVSIREKMRIYNGYTIKTEAKSYAWIALDDTKLVKLDASSEVTVRKNGKSLELLVNSGSLLFNVTEPLKEDENLNICTATMVAGVRGTTGWVEARADGSGLAILEGRVVCNTAAGDSASVESGQSASFSAGGEIEQGKIDLNETPGFVLTDVVNDPALCAEIMEKSGLDIGSVTPEQAAAKQAKDEAAAAAVEAANQAAAQQSASDNSSSDNSGGGSSTSSNSSESKPPVTPNGIPCGDFIVRNGKKGIDFSYNDSVLTILTSAELTIEGTTTRDRIEVYENAGDVNIILCNVQIDVSDTDKPAFLIPNGYGSKVKIALAGENILKSGYGCAGLQKNDMSQTESGTLTITGSGKLTAQGGKKGAGIGGGLYAKGSTSNIVISGGVITAKGGAGATGIGAGNDSIAGTGYVTISGGVVTASGGDQNKPGIGHADKVALTLNGDAFVNIETGTTDGTSVDVKKGIVFCSGLSETMMGNVTLSYNAEIPEGATLTVPSGSILTIDEDVTLTNKGTLVVNGSLRLNGTLQLTGGNETFVHNGNLDKDSAGTIVDLEDNRLSVKDLINLNTAMLSNEMEQPVEEMETPAEDETPTVSDETEDAVQPEESVEPEEPAQSEESTTPEDENAEDEDSTDPEEPVEDNPVLPPTDPEGIPAVEEPGEDAEPKED